MAETKMSAHRDRPRTSITEAASQACNTGLYRQLAFSTHNSDSSAAQSGETICHTAARGCLQRRC